MTSSQRSQAAPNGAAFYSESDPMAAAWVGRPRCIELRHARVILAAAQWAGLSVRQLAEVVTMVGKAESVEALTPDGFARMTDVFVASGFRHLGVPMISPRQVRFLDAARRRVGLDGRGFVALVRQLGGVASRHHLDGEGFIALWKWFAEHGSEMPVPGHGYMTREAVAMVHRATYRRGLSSDTMQGMLVRFGGVIYAGQLDERGFLRVMHVMAHIAALPEEAPPPRVAGDLGMVTQAQANLIWRGWLDVDGWKGDTSPAALERAIGSLLGMEGGLASLTRAGARAVIDRFMVPRLNDRRAAEGAGGPPDGRPAASQRRGKKGGRR